MSPQSSAYLGSPFLDTRPRRQEHWKNGELLYSYFFFSLKVIFIKRKKRKEEKNCRSQFLKLQ